MPHRKPLHETDTAVLAELRDLTTCLEAIRATHVFRDAQAERRSTRLLEECTEQLLEEERQEEAEVERLRSMDASLLPF